MMPKQNTLNNETQQSMLPEVTQSEEKPILFSEHNPATGLASVVEQDGFRYFIHCLFKSYYYYKCEDNKGANCKGCLRIAESK